MGLIDLKTNLKSLKYGKDRPGGNSSGQPYIQTPIPDERNELSSNFLVRDGILQSDRREKDVLRLSKFFSDKKSPNALRFVTNLNLLSRLSVETEASTGPAYGGNGGFNQGIYNPLSTLAQAGVQGLGIHLNLLGIDPTGLSNLSIQKYEDVIKGRNNDEKESNNRLVKLYKNNLSTKDTILREYSGGPGSVLGIGKTKITRNTFTLSNWNELNPENKIPGQGALTFDMPLLSKIKTSTKGSNQRYGPYAISEVYDFRKTLKEAQPEAKTLATTDYLKFNRETIYGLGSPGKRGVDRSNPNLSSVSPDTIDQINAQGILYSSKSDSAIKNLKEDIINFWFSIVNNDDPTTRDWLQFRAYIDSISDSYSPSHNNTQYVGRGENFYKYSGFERQLNLEFSVAAQTRFEMTTNYEKINYLASLTMPDYSKTGLMRGNIMYLTIGDYIVDTPGVLSSLTFNIPDESPWEIGRLAEEGQRVYDSGFKQLPHMIKVNMGFKVIHNFLPKKSLQDEITPIINYLSNEISPSNTL